jgi:hypothetical protein
MLPLVSWKEFFIHLMTQKISYIEPMLKAYPRLANAQNPDTGIKAIHIATDRGDKAILQLLLENDAEVNSMSKTEDTALHLAAIKGLKEIIEVLINNKYIDINIKNCQGFTGLHYTSRAGYKQATITLLNHKDISVNESDNLGHTALHFAAYNGHLDIVKLLVEKKVNIMATNLRGESALDLAKQNNKHEVVDYLSKVIRARYHTPRVSPPSTVITVSSIAPERQIEQADTINKEEIGALSLTLMKRATQTDPNQRKLGKSAREEQKVSNLTEKHARC